jgi:thiol-disulfide isomerase/thioredoxin
MKVFIGKGTWRNEMRSKLLVSFVLVTVLIAACTPQAVPEVTQVEVPASEDAAEPAVAESSVQSVDFSIPGEFEIKLYQGQDVYGGEVVSISSIFAEGKPVVINFYAGMCPTCIVELPRMQVAYEKYGEQVNFVLVDIGPFVGLGTELDGTNMLTAVKVQIPGGCADDVQVVRDYEVLGTPAAAFYYPDGTLSSQHAGLMSEELIDETIAKLLQ